jgi:tetratricopeptide (TPR) repeat protein
MSHLDEQAVHALVSGTLDPAASDAARAHLDTCDDCRGLVAAAATGESTATIGRYQIVATVGTGAMGIVFEAIDPQLERRVAIKMLRDDAHRDRLLREARAAAKISHPNVIAVFDAGIADGGDVFMAMELIRGKTLRQWLAELQRAPRETVGALAKVGRGLAAIHRAELVHRDVKPDNVLVADDGRLVVTDLGLVRVEARAGDVQPGTVELTQTGAVVGTPAYAAPEQLDGLGDADARSDQFSFCVMLHEALAGERPFVAPSIAELRAAIDRGPPVLGGDEAIAAAVKRGLAVDPAARWPSMDALIDALERAIAPRRAKWLALGAVGVAAVAVTGGLWLGKGARTSEPTCDGGAAELARVWNPAVKAKLAQAFAGTKIAYAAATWGATANLVDAYGAHWTAAFDDACAATNVRHVQSQAVLDLRAQCLDRRRVELGALLDVLGTPDRTQIDLAATAVGALVSPEACADADLLSATDPVPDVPAQRTEVTALRADLARAEALYASGHFQQALDLTRTLSTRAGKLGYAPLAAEVDMTRGRVALDLEQWDEAKQALGAAALAAERGRHHRIRGDVQLALAYLAMQRGDREGALIELEKADAVVTGLGDAAANRARVEDYRGMTLADLGRLEPAKAALDKAVALYESAEGKDTTSLANPLTQLAYVANQHGDLASAISLLERALAIQVKAFGAEHPRVGFAHVNLAFNLSAAGRLDDAEKHAETARDILGRGLGTTSTAYADALRALVGIETTRGELPKAEAHAREVIAILEQGKGNPTHVASAVEDLANAVRAQLLTCLPISLGARTRCPCTRRRQPSSMAPMFHRTSQSVCATDAAVALSSLASVRLPYRSCATPSRATRSRRATTTARRTR